MPNPLNKVELDHLHCEADFRHRVTELFAIRDFYQSSIIDVAYIPGEVFATAVVPTDAGSRRIEFLVEEAKVARSDAHMALLLSPYQYEIEVDLAKSDLNAMWERLSADIIGKQIRHPWVFGRLLYDRFFELFPSRTQSLSGSETGQLLANSPYGVFQIGKKIVGPFGVLSSAEDRYLKPADTAPLWHCSDPACRALHPVKFGKPTTRVKAALSALNKHRAAEGQRSEWVGFYSKLVDPWDWYDHTYPASLPFLVANAFAADEQQIILHQLLENTDIRNLLPKSRRFRSMLSGPAKQISAHFGPDHLLQTILLAHDKQIVCAIEDSIAAGCINIPATEVRTPRICYSRNGWFDSVAQCSRMGVRFQSSHPGFAVRNLRATVTHVYASAEDSEELGWKLRHHKGANVFQRVDNYLREKEPAIIIRELFLDSRQHVKRLFDALRYGSFSVPVSIGEEESLISKVVWKLGFKPPIYPRTHERFRIHLKSMREVLAGTSELQIEARDRIRSVGVNLFVGLEEILDYSLFLSGWALLADAYEGRRFTFRLSQARAFVASTLNRSEANTQSLSFDVHGKNTLYALVFGFDVLAREVQAVNSKPENFLRRKGVPGYEKSIVEPFPLRHTRAMLDCEPSDISAAIGTLSLVTRELNTAGVMDIRNRLDHQREDFPSKAELTTACDDLQRIVDHMEDSRLFSPPSIVVGSTYDQHARGFVQYQDYRDRSDLVAVPPLCSVLPIAGGPMILLSSLRFKDSSEFIRFRLEETSRYTDLWEGYPRRRPRISQSSSDLEHATVQEDETQESSI